MKKPFFYFSPNSQIIDLSLEGHMINNLKTLVHTHQIEVWKQKYQITRNFLTYKELKRTLSHFVSLYIYMTAIKFCKHRSKIWYTSLCKKGHFGVLNLHWFSLNWIFFVPCELSKCFTRRGFGFCHWRIKGADNTTQTAFQCRLLGHKAGIKGDRGNWGNPNLWYSLPGAMSWLRRGWEGVRCLAAASAEKQVWVCSKQIIVSYKLPLWKSSSWLGVGASAHKSRRAFFNFYHKCAAAHGWPAGGVNASDILLPSCN